MQRLLEQKITLLSKPFGALGLLEDIAVRIGLILNTDHPELEKPALLVFAGDHGIVREALNHRQEEHTYQTMLDFLHGTEVVNTLVEGSGMEIKLIDAGVDHSFESNLTYWLHHGTTMVNCKVSFGTNNFLDYPAMTTAETERAMKLGMDMAEKTFRDGSNILGIAEMGRSNFVSALAVYCALLEKTPYEILSTADRQELREEAELISKALKKHPISHQPLTILSLYGGFEFAAMTGAILRAAQLGLPVLLDSFGASVSALAAERINPKVLDYCLFAHSSRLSAHEHLLAHVNRSPILDMRIRIGEGAGILLAFPVIAKAVELLRNRPHREREE